MDWQNERWVKLYTRDSGDILAIGWEGRYVLWELMRKVDRSGIIDETDDGVIAEMLRIPHDITERGLAKLAKRGVIARTEDGVVIPNFLEAQEARSSNKQRQAEFRARKRESALKVTPAGESVTNGYEKVTQNNAASHGVTTRVEESRVEETRQVKPAPKRACQIPDSWQPNERGLALAAELGIDAAEEAESFRDYWLGEGKTKKDWDATFRNRLKAAAKRQAEREAKAPRGPVERML